MGWGAAGACDVIQDGGHVDRHLGFYQKLKLSKAAKIGKVNASHVKYDIIKHFTTFCMQFLLFSPKKGKKTQFYPKMA